MLLQAVAPVSVYPMLPTFPEVRCDNCRHVYTVNEPPSGGLIHGLCPKCGKDRFSTTFVGTEGVASVVEWSLLNTTDAD